MSYRRFAASIPWRFLSLTTAGQVCLVVNQIVLLPLQLRVWGHDVTAQWFVVIAIANLVTISDLGFRIAGHSHLLSSVRSANHEDVIAFRQIWALTRALIVSLTVIILCYRLVLGTASAILVCSITVSLALDTLITVRGIWFDTLGYFNEVEGNYLAMAASRILLSIIGLVVFRASPVALGLVMLATSIGGIVGQTYLLREPNSLAFLAGGLRDVRWRLLGMVRFVVSDPVTNWVRVSLPVVVFAAFAPPTFITTYVAIRAIFGLVRNGVVQISRYAAVQYVLRIDAGKANADNMAARAILATTATSVAVASAAIADNGRLLHLWLGGEVHASFIVLSFAFGAIVCGYQIISGILVRSGDVAGFAKRQYVYLLTSAGAAVAVRFVPNPVNVYLALLALQEIIIAGMFVTAIGPNVARASIAAIAIAFAALALLCTVIELDAGAMFSSISPMAVAISFGVMMTTIGAVMAAFLVIGCGWSASR